MLTVALARPLDCAVTSLRGRIKLISSRLGLTRSAPWTLWYARHFIACARVTVHRLQVANAGVNEIGEYFTPKVKNGQLQKPTMATVDVNLLGSIYSKSNPANYTCCGCLIGVCSSCPLGHPLSRTRTKTGRYTQVYNTDRFDGYVSRLFPLIKPSL